MPDREKVIAWLNEIVNTLGSFTDDSEQEVCQLAKDTLALLKEQEEPKPIIRIIRKQCKIENSDGSIDYYAEWFCPHCKSLLQRGFDTPWMEYCYKCGKPITCGRSVKR